MPRRPAAKDCRHRLLARGEAHQITLCTCGSVHLTVGNTTLRLKPESFGALAESVARATAQIDPQPVALPSTVH
ncbi:MAG: hypothetical protein CL931_09425 [Deltaproteobacteria bacterium]|nr:hypothetical protein [Deltaproteobacteria bacterium]